MNTLGRLSDAPDVSWATRMWCTGAPRQPFSLRSLVMPPASDRALCSGERVKRGGLVGHIEVAGFAAWLGAGAVARWGLVVVIGRWVEVPLRHVSAGLPSICCSGQNRRWLQVCAAGGPRCLDLRAVRLTLLLSAVALHPGLDGRLAARPSRARERGRGVSACSGRFIAPSIGVGRKVRTEPAESAVKDPYGPANPESIGASDRSGHWAQPSAGARPRPSRALSRSSRGLGRSSRRLVAGVSRSSRGLGHWSAAVAAQSRGLSRGDRARRSLRVARRSAGHARRGPPSGRRGARSGPTRAAPVCPRR